MIRNVKKLLNCLSTESSKRVSARVSDYKSFEVLHSRENLSLYTKDLFESYRMYEDKRSDFWLEKVCEYYQICMFLKNKYNK